MVLLVGGAVDVGGGGTAAGGNSGKLGRHEFIVDRCAEKEIRSY